MAYDKGTSAKPHNLPDDIAMPVPVKSSKGMISGSRLMLPAIKSGQSLERRIGKTDPMEWDTKKDDPIRPSS